jgi:hypothetical protein
MGEAMTPDEIRASGLRLVDSRECGPDEEAVIRGLLALVDENDAGWLKAESELAQEGSLHQATRDRATKAEAKLTRLSALVDEQEKNLSDLDSDYGTLLREHNEEITSLTTERDALRTAITPKHAQEWPVEHVVALAEAHREDSEVMDANELASSDSYGTDYDYDAARLQIRQRMTTAEAERDALQVQLREYGQHKPECPTRFENQYHGQPEETKTCTCGFTSLSTTGTTTEPLVG